MKELVSDGYCAKRKILQTCFIAWNFTKFHRILSNYKKHQQSNMSSVIVHFQLSTEVSFENMSAGHKILGIYKIWRVCDSFVTLRVGATSLVMDRIINMDGTFMYQCILQYQNSLSLL